MLYYLINTGGTDVPHRGDLMRKMAKITLLTVTLLSATAAFGGAEEGKEMFDEAKCMECHNSEDFKASKKVKDFHQLEARVDACQRNSDAGWFDEDTHDVATYLNKAHYHLKK